MFAHAKTKAQIRFAIIAKLISAFVLATRIVQFLFFLNTKFQAPIHLLKLQRPVYVRPGRKPRRPGFSRRGSNVNISIEIRMKNIISFNCYRKALRASQALQQRYVFDNPVKAKNLNFNPDLHKIPFCISFRF